MASSSSLININSKSIYGTNQSTFTGNVIVNNDLTTTGNVYVGNSTATSIQIYTNGINGSVLRINNINELALNVDGNGGFIKNSAFGYGQANPTTASNFTTENNVLRTNWTIYGVQIGVSTNLISSAFTNYTAPTSGTTSGLTLKNAGGVVGNTTYIKQLVTLPTAGTYTLSYTYKVWYASWTTVYHFVGTTSAWEVSYGGAVIDNAQPLTVQSAWTTKTVTITTTGYTSDYLIFKSTVNTTGNTPGITLTDIKITSAETIPYKGAINLNPAGGVGIKTNAPMYDLDVSGTMRVVGNTTCSTITALTNFNSIATTVWNSTSVSGTHFNIPYPIPRIIKITGVAGGIYHLPAGRDLYYIPNGVVISITSNVDVVVVGSYITDGITNTTESTAQVATYSQDLTGGTVAEYYYYNDGITLGLWCRSR